MITSIYLLTCALTLAQGSGRADWQLTPQLAPGLELVYRGVCSEESLIPFVQHQTHYRMETHFLVLDATAKDWQVAIMTSMSLQEARQGLGKKEGPMSVRLQTAHVDRQGRCRGADKKLLSMSLKGPPTLEFGYLVPAPTVKVGVNSAWDAGDGKLPPERWQIIGTEACGGLTCIKIAGLQQSPDWDSPRADRTAWRRRDVVWLHPQRMVAQKVERIIERREPARDTPTHRTVVRYELDSPVQYPPLLFQDRRQDFLKAARFHEDAEKLLREPALNRQQIDGLIQRVSFHLNRPPGNQAQPFRKAVLHVKTVLEKAQKGEAPVPHKIDDPPQAPKTELGVGRRVPDFAVTSLTEKATMRWRGEHGKPSVVIFYNPATKLGHEVMTYAKQLSEAQKGGVTLLALAVTPSADIARRQHKDMNLPFPVLDGNGMRLMFGAAQTPRFVVIDADGLYRLGVTGWGYETPVLIEDTLRNCRKR